MSWRAGQPKRRLPWSISPYPQLAGSPGFKNNTAELLEEDVLEPDFRLESQTDREYRREDWPRNTNQDEWVWQRCTVGTVSRLAFLSPRGCIRGQLGTMLCTESLSSRYCAGIVLGLRRTILFGADVSMPLIGEGLSSATTSDTYCEVEWRDGGVNVAPYVAWNKEDIG